MENETKNDSKDDQEKFNLYRLNVFSLNLNKSEQGYLKKITEYLIVSEFYITLN